MSPEDQSPSALQQAPVPPVYHVGNAAADNVGGTGWFIGQFVPGNLGPRHQTAIELKWGVHARGERRPGGQISYGVATTISIVVRGAFKTTIIVDGHPIVVTLKHEGDYIIVGPDVPHIWEALEDSVILSIRFPSVDMAAAAQLLAGR